MKKFFSFAIASLFVFALVSCSSVESKAKKYVKDTYEAGSKLDFEKVSEIAKESRDYYESLSDEDKEIYDKATAEAITEYSAKMAGKVKNVTKGFGEALDAIGSLTGDDNSSSDEADDSSDDDDE